MTTQNGTVEGKRVIQTGDSQFQTDERLNEYGYKRMNVNKLETDMNEWD